MLWPSLSAWQFAAAGLCCAAIPLVIHLLNRRRFRVVEWGAMDFLREAVRRNRRILHLRDLLLLILRTLAVLLFGLALARPHLASRNEKFDGSQPLHAVLVIDNSLSMAYQLDNERLLDRALRRAREFVERLPRGSRISLIPACGSNLLIGSDPFDSQDAALEALQRIDIVDRTASMQRAMNESRRACEVFPELAKRVVLFGDQQHGNWSGVAGAAMLAGLPSLQVVDLGPGDWENSWISDLRLQDGLADTETPATFLVEVQYRGRDIRRDVQLTLQVDEIIVGTRSLTLDPAEGARQVAFEYQFTGIRPEPGQAEFVPVRAVLSPDRLAEDDERFLMAPVVAALPVIFIDQFSESEEDPLRQRLGETRHLRKLLSPAASKNAAASQLVTVRHLKIGDLTRELLSDARLVVIAGIERPGNSVPLLREYLEQGGQMVIAAGAAFDPVAWNLDGWRDGEGILPAPLRTELIGALPEVAGERAQPFFISYDSMAADDYFQLADTSPDELRELYEQPFFFQAVDVDVSDSVVETVRRIDDQRLADQADRITLAMARQSGAVLGADGAAGASGRFVEQELENIVPRWLTWGQAREPASLASLSDEAAGGKERRTTVVEQGVPRTLARFTRVNSPYLVERQVGDGRVIFVASSVLSSWNTLPKTDTMFLFDRILRSMIESTLARRNYPTQERIQIPWTGEDRRTVIDLQRPGKEAQPEAQELGFIGTQQRGLTLANPFLRGIYRFTGMRPGANPLAPVPGNAAGAADPALTRTESSAGSLNGSTGSLPGAGKSWELALAVNGLADESDLSRLSPKRRDELAELGAISWIGPNDEISLAGAQVRGQNFWWYLVLLVFLCLLAEIVTLGWSQWRNREIATVSG